MGNKNTRTETYIFHLLESQNPAVANVLHSFRLHGEPQNKNIESKRHYGIAHQRDYLLSDYGYRQQTVLPWLLLLIGIIALANTIGSKVIEFLTTHWKTLGPLLGSTCVGAGIVLIVSRVGSNPLQNIAPPSKQTNDPLEELKHLAERAANRLRVSYNLQLWATAIVGIIFVALVVWSMVMVSKEQILYASAFGSSSIAMAVLSQWKWQPFDRINQARKLADDADILATGLRLRMASISEITDPAERSAAQWIAVKEYLDRS